ncbi:MAG TPA: ATP-binding protein [Candidatus Limnocylindria bacterium]|jgi:two-component system phosphate regulon sensor histidine kinase PhoR
MTDSTDSTDSPDEALSAILARRGDDGLVVTDAGLHIVEISAEAAALAERPPAELAGLSLIAAFGSAPLDVLARSALGAGEPASGEAALGPLAARQFEAQAIPLPSGGLLLWLHDVTAARRAAQARRDVVANISHELRTPLASIKLLAETLSDGAVADEDTSREFAIQIQREVDHLAQLVDELLDLSMIESGESELVIEPVAPRRILEDVAERIGPIAARRDVSVRNVLPPADAAGGVRAAADPARLAQALLNLAHNAVKYSHRGGEIRLGWDPTPGGVRFWVADDGIGVPLAHRERIFERFYKADRARARGARGDDTPELGGASAGLGLAIVRHIAEAHGGTVGVESEENVGSTFWVEVPQVQA